MSRKANTPYHGRYCVRIYLGRVDGKKKYKAVYGKTQAEADEKARQVRNALDRGIDIAAENDTFGYWSQKWLEIKKSEVSERWYQNYECYVKRMTDLSGMAISKIKAADIQKIILDLAKENPRTHKPTSRRTLKGYKDAIQQIMQLAIDNRIMDYNPAKAVKIPAEPPKPYRRALTSEEQKWIEETPHRAQRAAMIMMFSGLRRGEVIPLTWSDIDFNEHTIRVNKSVEMVNGYVQMKPTAKTKASIRLVNIPTKLVLFLKAELRKEQQKAQEGGVLLNVLVCPSATGRMMSDSAWRRMWDSYLVDLNFKYGNRVDKSGKEATSKYNSNGIVLTIPNITAHWLRHTFATMLYLSGVDVLTAKDQLGHTDIKTTLDIYTHLDQQYKKKNICKLDAYLAERA